MRRLLTALLCACLVLSGCATTPSSETQIVEPVSYHYPDEYASPADPEIAEGLEESVYASLREALNSEDFLIDEVEVAYVSQEYLDELQYNSQENVFFGYTLPEIRDYFEGVPYVFTVENGVTVVKPFEDYDDTWEQVAVNVATGTGVIAVCATVTVLAPAVGAPTAVTAIFTFATGGAVSGAVVDAAISGVFTGITTGVQTGDIEQAIKAAALSASEDYKCGAIIGAAAAGAAEGVGLLKASKYAKKAGEAGLTMSEAAKVQLESGFSLKTIRNMRNMDEYEVYKSAGLKECIVKTPEGTRRVLARDLDMKIADKDGRTNLQRMEKGLNPIDENGVTYDYHHVGQKNDGTLALLSKHEHRMSGLHSKQMSEIERNAFNREKRQINKISAAQLYEQVR